MVVGLVLTIKYLWQFKWQRRNTQKLAVLLQNNQIILYFLDGLSCRFLRGMFGNFASLAYVYPLGGTWHATALKMDIAIYILVVA